MDKRSGIYNYFNMQPPERMENKNMMIIMYILLGLSLIIVLAIWQSFLTNFFAVVAIVAFAGAGLIWGTKNNAYNSALAQYQNTMPDDNDMMAWFSEDLNDIVKARAFNRFELDTQKLEAERYLILPVPYVWKEPGVSLSTQQKGRFHTAYWVTVLFLTKKYVSVYTCVFDWSGGRIAHEETNEFFYNDVASIRTGNIELDRKLQSNEEQTIGSVYALRIVNVSGHTMDVFSQIPMAQAPVIVDMDQVVSRLRKMLRNRRVEEDLDFEVVRPDEKNEQGENEGEVENADDKNKE